MISVNVRDLSTHTPHFAPYTIVTVNGLTVGIVGYTTQSAAVGASLASTLEVADVDWNSADATPEAASAELAVTVTVARTMADESGNVTAPVGAVLSTRTLAMVAEVATFPATSVVITRRS